MGMATSVYDALEMIFGGGITSRIIDWCNTLWNMISSGIQTGWYDGIVSMLSGIAASLLIIYFIQDLMNQASRDMFSLEKFVTMMIKLIIGFCLLLVLPELTKYIVRIGYALYKAAAEGEFTGSLSASNSYNIKFVWDSSHELDYTGPSSWPAYEDVQEFFEAEYKGVLKLISHINLWFSCTILNIIGMVGKFAGYFIVTSNVVMLFVRAMFLPVAVVQCFEDGSRSAGIRYLKGFAAECITMAIIVLILYVAAYVSQGLLIQELSDAWEVDVGDPITITLGDNVYKVLSMKRFGVLLIPQFVAIGGMGSGSKIAHDILGA